MTVGWKRWICLAWLCLIPYSGNAVTPMVAAGQDNSLFLNSDGSVWGTGSFKPPSPVRVLHLPNIIGIATSQGTDIALLSDGTVWASGNNSSGKLGDGTTTQYRPEPQLVPGLSGVRAIAVNSHVLALKQDGTVWAWGGNSSGQLGDGTRTDRHVPTQVIGLADITAISAGQMSSLALRADGTVWVWGITSGGAAGDGSIPSSPNDPNWVHVVPTQVLNLDQVTSIAAGVGHHLALRTDGTVWSWGGDAFGQNGTGQIGLTNQLLPIQVPGLDHVTAIVEDSHSSSMALKSDGTVWGWGNNSVGQLGVSGISYSAGPIQIPGLSDIVAISASNTHRLALRRDGTVLAWGTNKYGQLGDNSLQDRGQPVPVSAPGGTGQLNLLQPAPTSFNQLPNAQISLSVSSGRAPLTVQATAINATDPDGSVSAFYWKTSDGQQATGSSATFTFATAGTYDIQLLVEDNSGGRGLGGQLIVVSPALSAAITVNPKVQMGSAVGVALANDGRILTWGLAPFLGLYNRQFLALPEANSHPIANGVTAAVDVVVGSTSAVTLLLSDGTVLGWGPNESGQVGSGSPAPYLDQPQVVSNLPPVQALAAGGFHGLALTRDGRVFAWGGNTAGQLGLGDSDNRSQPAEVMGLADVIAVAAGGTFSVAVKADGTVWAWGDNFSYALGDGSQISRNRPIQIPGLADVNRIFASGSAVFAQKADGTVWVTGRTPFDSSIYGDPGPAAGARRLPVLDGAVQIAGTDSRVLVLRADGTILSGGSQQDLALGFQSGGDTTGLRPIPGISDAIQVATGQYSSAALRRDGTVLAWGLNDVGQVGDGTLALQQSPVLVLNEDINGFLDLIPEVPNTIPSDKIPPFLVATYNSGGLSSTTLYADLRGIISTGSFAWASDFGRFAAGYNVYVAASVPSGGASLYFQLDANNSWSSLRWPMAEFMRGVTLDSQDALVRAQILQNADLSSPQFVGSSILVGYGTDPDEMLRSARYRTIFTVPLQ